MLLQCNTKNSSRILPLDPCELNPCEKRKTCVPGEMANEYRCVGKDHDLKNDGSKIYYTITYQNNWLLNIQIFLE